ncbi:WXG100 family type VII secretion target [Plantactinospora sp. CA-294935]|uniref:WXG100 family type VII secretion target n=1 Tax=Plantactinospora sp. CA-294935 TaxID=3240012 RepID=UPI003D94C040
MAGGTEELVQNYIEEMRETAGQVRTQATLIESEVKGAIQSGTSQMPDDWMGAGGAMFGEVNAGYQQQLNRIKVALDGLAELLNRVAEKHEFTDSQIRASMVDLGEGIPGTGGTGVDTSSGVYAALRA